MSDDLVVVQTFTDDISAHIARAALEAALTFSNRIRIVVRREDAEEAVRVLDEADSDAEDDDPG